MVHPRYNKHRGRYHRPKRFRRHYSLFQRMTYFARRHPISVGVVLVVASIVLFRLSFTNTFLNSSEIFMWSIIVSILLFFGGLLTLIAWWRNHVATLNTRHTVNWRKR